MIEATSSMKLLLYQHCLTYINSCIHNAQLAINDASQSGNNETKSSAGDKHETGRALLQLEQEKNTRQLYEAIALKEKLLRINPHHSAETIGLGSLVLTTNGNFYIAIAAGKIEVNEKNYVSISSSSPVAIKLWGKKMTDKIEMSGRFYEILSVI